MKYHRSELRMPVRRNIWAKEKNLSRKCRAIWDFTNPEGHRYLFGRFCNGQGMKDTVICTLAYFEPNVQKFIPIY